MIVNVRGTNGSGKSTLVVGIRNLGPYEPVFIPERKREIGYITPAFGTAVVGAYTTKCGGCDTIKTQDEVRAYVRYLATKTTHTVFEGVLLCTIFNPWVKFSRENGTNERFGPTVWAFLDTPYELCLERVYQRNGGKKIDETGVRSKFDANLRFKDRAAQFGEHVETIRYNHALDDLRNILGI